MRVCNIARKGRFAAKQQMRSQIPRATPDTGRDLTAHGHSNEMVSDVYRPHERDGVTATLGGDLLCDDWSRLRSKAESSEVLQQLFSIWEFAVQPLLRGGLGADARFCASFGVRTTSSRSCWR